MRPSAAAEVDGEEGAVGVVVLAEAGAGLVEGTAAEMVAEMAAEAAEETGHHMAEVAVERLMAAGVGVWVGILRRALLRACMGSREGAG